MKEKMGDALFRFSQKRFVRKLDRRVEGPPSYRNEIQSCIIFHDCSMQTYVVDFTTVVWYSCMYNVYTKLKLGVGEPWRNFYFYSLCFYWFFWLGVEKENARKQGSSSMFVVPFGISRAWLLTSRRLTISFPDDRAEIRKRSERFVLQPYNITNMWWYMPVFVCVRKLHCIVYMTICEKTIIGERNICY